MNTSEMTRDELLKRARSILHDRNYQRYGIDAVDEGWLNSLSDDHLRLVVDSDNPNPLYGSQ
jgi:hypothetical protein